MVTENSKGVGGGGSQKQKFLKENMKLNWNFQRGGVVGDFKTKNIHGGGMDILWNNTMLKCFACLEQSTVHCHFHIQEM